MNYRGVNARYGVQSKDGLVTRFGARIDPARKYAEVSGGTLVRLARSGSKKTGNRRVCWVAHKESADSEAHALMENPGYGCQIPTGSGETPHDPATCWWCRNPQSETEVAHIHKMLVYNNVRSADVNGVPD